jgi:hypothetical protein
MGVAFLFRPRHWLLAVSVVLVANAPQAAEPEQKANPAIDFNRQIRPILSENCFACHGPDEKQRKAKLRFDSKEGALGKLRDGSYAIVPGKIAESELVRRITAEDPGEIMPPPKSGKKLKPEQIALLKEWIAQGAPWSSHWAFIPPQRPAVPTVRKQEWVRNPIDAFILAKLEAAGLTPSPEADRTTLIRRVTLDLTGLPPAPAEVDAFLSDSSPNAYEKVVDRLLRSPRYGEHMARYWLDAARYGDTHGLHLDNYREIWPYREWVIKAFNANKPYDRFVVEQLAGDLLPDAKLDQIIATGFNRCHVSTSEGGSIEEEVYVRNVDDQVDTNGNVFLGLSVGCARCHDHKYDPITQKDYYQLFAIFNSIDGPALDGNAALPAPSVRVPAREQTAALADLQYKAGAIQRAIAEVREVPKRDTKPRNEIPAKRSALAPLYRRLAEIDKQRAELEKTIPATLVFKERKEPRPAYILKRGEYDQRGSQVGRDTPAFLPPLPAGAPRDRLGFARWLVQPNHPLTARVAVNRLWQQVFGTGLVKTTEDFGTQGEPPSHPELLDWMADEFMASGRGESAGWNIKAMMKRLVMSATYRQSSKLTPERLAKDPTNRLLSRGPRYRLDAEMLRDQALFVSGLLVEKLGGPSVKPPQPSGLWEAVAYTGSNTAKFKADTGCEKVHRRSLYTFWKRTAPPPQMTALDAPSRESCTLRRERTDTPLQALLMMNEKQFVECARALAERTLREGRTTLEDRLTFLFLHATARKPDAGELAELANTYHDHLAEYRRDVSAAKKLIAIGETKPDAALDPSELAAWTMVANLVLNLDEVLNKG